MTRKIFRCFLMMCCVGAAPLLAQTTTTTTTTTKTKVSTKSKATSASTKMRVYNDATSLAALLDDAQTTATVSADMWKTIGNEANSLANRIYGATSGNSTARAAAKELRTHVQAFQKAALAGDAATAKEHAGEAMEFVSKLTEWAMPAKK